MAVPAVSLLRLIDLRGEKMEFFSNKRGSGLQHTFIKDQKIGGEFIKVAEFIENEQLTDEPLWAKFVDQYRIQPDSPTLAWRGEYWGKMMRGAASVYSYSKSERLYAALEKTVIDMMSVQAPDGRVSSYSRDKELTGWDLWCRKYVLLGMLYFYDMCKSEALKEKILVFLKAHTDYIIDRIGNEDGKKDITIASTSWFGINSSSILEPIVWLYKYTGEQRYLDFATYIVERGGADRYNVFELAYENKLLPYQYGVSKAYELTSCFEGLIAYYEVTGIEKYKTAAINYGKAILSSEESVIGSLGVTHELLDHTLYTQTSGHGEMQETCVTVTWMKYCASLYRLTGDTIFADAIEKSFYNAFLGSVNTEKRESDYMRRKFEGKPEAAILKSCFMPFDSYSPLTPGYRANGVGGNQLLSDGSYYGCCACIGAVGIGVYSAHRLLMAENGVTLSFFDDGEESFEYNGANVKISVSGGYPKNGSIRIKLSTDKKISLALKIRIPAWSKHFTVKSNKKYVYDAGLLTISDEWCGESEISIELDMKLRRQLPLSWESDVVYTDMTGSSGGYHFAYAQTIHHLPEYDDYIALFRGPITLAADSSLGKPADSVFSFYKENGEEVYSEQNTEKSILKLRFVSEDKSEFDLIDYASAGKDWKTLIAAWLPTK